jgi:hypothetical protein
MIPLLGFTPDLDPTTPGAMFEVENMIPTRNGMALAKAGITPYTLPAGTTQVYAVTTATISGQEVTLVVRNGGVYEQYNSVWTNISALSGANSNRAKLIAYGKVGLFINQERLHLYTPGVGGVGTLTLVKSFNSSPQDICTLNGFVMLVGSLFFGDSGDSWACSDQYDYTNWTPADGNQAKDGRLLDTAGAIRAIVPIGENAIIYKENNMYIGRNVGPPFVWDWDLIPYADGAASASSVVYFNDRHYVKSTKGFYVYDGSVPRPIDGFIKHWYFDTAFLVSGNNHALSTGFIDKERETVYWCNKDYPLASRVVAYHIPTGKWGVASYNAEHLFGFVYPDIALSYIDLSNLTAIQTVNYSNNTTLTGKFTSNIFGDEGNVSDCEKIQLRFTHQPVTTSCTGYANGGEGEAFVQADTSTMADNKFDMRQSGRFHQFKFTMDGSTFGISKAAEVTHIRPAFTEDGTR